MNTEHDNEQIARWLDGEPVELTDAQRALADAMRDDQSAVGAYLNAAPSDDAVRQSQMAVQFASAQQGNRNRFRRFVGATAAIAAAACLVMLFAAPTNDPNTAGPVPGPVASNTTSDTDALLGAWDVSDDGFDVEMNLLAEALDQTQAELIVSEDSPSQLDTRIDTLEQQIDGFWEDDTSVSMTY
jgi:hypothetical protein